MLKLLFKKDDKFTYKIIMKCDTIENSSVEMIISPTEQQGWRNVECPICHKIILMNKCDFYQCTEFSRENHLIVDNW